MSWRFTEAGKFKEAISAGDWDALRLSSFKRLLSPQPSGFSGGRVEVYNIVSQRNRSVAVFLTCLFPHYHAPFIVKIMGSSC